MRASPETPLLPPAHGPGNLSAALSRLEHRWGSAAVRLGSGRRVLASTDGALAPAMLPEVEPELDPFAPPDDRVISTGFSELDAILGPGGLVREAHVTLRGGGSCGKTTLALRLMAEAQRRGAIVAYLDLARSFDPLEAAARGVDLDWLLVLRAGGMAGASGGSDGMSRADRIGAADRPGTAADQPGTADRPLQTDRPPRAAAPGISGVGAAERAGKPRFRTGTRGQEPRSAEVAEGLRLAGALLGGRTVDLLVVDLPDRVPALDESLLRRLAARARQVGARLVVLEPLGLTSSLRGALAETSGVGLDLERRAWIRVGRDIVGQFALVTVTRNRFGPPGRRTEIEIRYLDEGDRDRGLARVLDARPDAGAPPDPLGRDARGRPGTSAWRDIRGATLPPLRRDAAHA